MPYIFVASRAHVSVGSCERRGLTGGPLVVAGAGRVLARVAAAGQPPHGAAQRLAAAAAQEGVRHLQHVARHLQQGYTSAIPLHFHFVSLYFDDIFTSNLKA